MLNLLWYFYGNHRCRLLKEHPRWVSHKQDWGRGFILLLPQADVPYGSDAGSDSVHRVSSSRTLRPRASCGARCLGHVIWTWSTICSVTRHWQFNGRAITDPVCAWTNGTAQYQPAGE